MLAMPSHLTEVLQEESIGMTAEICGTDVGDYVWDAHMRLQVLHLKAVAEPEIL